MQIQPSGVELVGQLREQPEKRTWLKNRPAWALERISRALGLATATAGQRYTAAELVDRILLADWQRAAGAAPDPLADAPTQASLW